MGLMPAGSGRVTVDGTPLDPARALSWREGIGYVGQDTYLFHDTVRANLLWARPDANENQLRAALRKAAADEFVARLPDGIDTIVGDRGATLSQGERQRLALARAILRQPRLLVLDESTNSLDSGKRSENPWRDRADAGRDYDRADRPSAVDHPLGRPDLRDRRRSSRGVGRLDDSLSQAGRPVPELVRRAGVSRLMMQQTPAAELLLAVARRFAGIESPEEIRLRASRVTDWRAAMDLARAHGMEPLAAYYINTDCAGMFAPEFHKRLRAILVGNTAKFVVLSTDLIKVLRILEGRGIPVVPLKGPVLAEKLFSEIPWRDSCDLDLLIPRIDIGRAKDALSQRWLSARF